MKRLKQTISMLLMLSLVCMYAAASTPVPQEIIKDSENGLMTVQKVYVLPKTESGESIPTEGYTEDGIEYVFTELVTKDNSQTDTKEHTETVSIHTDTNNTSAVISQFKPSLEISTEDGYTGTLELDYTTLDVKAKGYGTKNYTVTEERRFPNLSDADTSLVPKTIDKDGMMLNLTNISWQSAASDSIDGQTLAVRYTATATYSGTGTRTYAKGYTATAQYKGTVERITNDTVTYIAVFTEKKPDNIFLEYWWVLLIGIGVFAVCGYGSVLLVQRRRRGY